MSCVRDKLTTTIATLGVVLRAVVVVGDVVEDEERGQTRRAPGRHIDYAILPESRVRNL